MTRNGIAPGGKPDYWRDLSPGETAADLTRCYGERAGEEVLFRALLAERNLDRGAVHFWLGVYTELGGKRAAVA